MDWNKQNILSTKYIVIAIGISVIIGALLLFLTMYFLGVFGTAEDKILMQQYKEEKAKSEKILQAALVEAEKQKELAETQIKKNRELEAKLLERDKNRNAELKANDERRKQENDKIVQEYNADINRANNMSEPERDQDICSRLERLSASNPSLAQFRCVSNSQ